MECHPFQLQSQDHFSILTRAPQAAIAWPLKGYMTTTSNNIRSHFLKIPDENPELPYQSFNPELMIRPLLVDVVPWRAGGARDCAP